MVRWNFHAESYSYRFVFLQSWKFHPVQIYLCRVTSDCVVLNQINVMSKTELQKIVVYLPSDGSDSSLIQAGIRLAVVFRKELRLLSLVTGQQNLHKSEDLLQNYTGIIRQQFPDLPVSAVALIHPGKILAKILADEWETILLIAGTHHFCRLSDTLRMSPVPFLFINTSKEITSEFKKIIIPVDLRKQNKDSLLWSVFFGRNNRSEVIAIGANDRSAESRKQVNVHLNSLKRLLVKSEIPHKIYRGSRGSLAIQEEALETAAELGADMMILLGSSYITWLDRLIGLPEAKIIRKAATLPILVVNPRRETYLVCD
jgi:nucleotide-binding universal stress UspA family protein